MAGKLQIYADKINREWTRIDTNIGWESVYRSAFARRPIAVIPQVFIRVHLR